MNQRRIAGSKLVTQLTHRFDEGQRLDVAHRTADLGDDYVVLLALRQQLNAALDFVRDMRNDLHGLAQVLALALHCQSRTDKSYRWSRCWHGWS